MGTHPRATSANAGHVAAKAHLGIDPLNQPLSLDNSLQDSLLTDRSSSETSVDDDRLLLSAMLQGDREAFTTFVGRQHGFVFGYLRSRLLEMADAEDLCQEVFLRCYLGKVKFRHDIPVRPWLLGVARNVLREHIRKVTRRKEVAWTELCLELDSLVDENYSDYNTTTQFLKQCIQTLGDSAKDALQMHYYAKMKMRQIGEILHRSEGAVKLLVYRARQALKNCITRKIQSGSDD
ncbi:MAG: RNA polymerase sigma factor [Pirellulales bacterium]